MSAAPSAGTPLEDAERWIVSTLEAAGCADPESDASLLLRDASGAATATLTPDAAAAIASSVARRARREPLGYIRGRVTFRGLEIEVDERVFIPRPETSPLVDAALAIPHGARVLEPCTGSGAVALALKHERPDLSVTASDRSADALAVARANAARLDIDVTFCQADGIAAVPGGPFDAVVSNPPYVAEAEAGTGSLPQEIELHEPPGAFWAGDDGLTVYRRFTAELGGVQWVAFEVGDGQGDAVAGMLRDAGFATQGALRVPSGQVRVVTAER
jgi:release factor glutamine methyltransferase